MSQFWKFSPSSESYYQRFVEAASQVNTENKWSENFGAMRSTCRLNITRNAMEVIETDRQTPSPAYDEENNISFTHEDLLDMLQSEHINLATISYECTKHPSFLTKMAEKLPNTAVEKLFNVIFTETNVDETFLALFSTTFLPKYFLCNFSLNSIDFLVKINDKHSEIFLKLLEILFNDVNLQKNVLSSYISTLNEEKLKEFVEKLSKLNISSEGFVHNLHTIYTAYKTCIKNDTVQENVKNLLIKYSKNCETDKTFGQFFLLYLQNEKNFARNIDTILINCLESNRSPFKKPCLNLIYEINV